MGLSRSSLSAAAAAWRVPLRPIMAAPQATTPSSRSGTSTGLPDAVLHHKRSLSAPPRRLLQVSMQHRKSQRAANSDTTKGLLGPATL